MDDDYIGLPMRASVIVSLLLLFCLGTTAESQTVQPQNFDAVTIYGLASRAKGEPARTIDSNALRLSRELVDARHTLIVIDQELLVVGHALGAFVASKNPGKSREGRLFTEQEIIPTYFRILRPSGIYLLSLLATLSQFPIWKPWHRKGTWEASHLIPIRATLRRLSSMTQRWSSAALYSRK